ncbi:13764_t:CDS:2, partial [Acaulospora colombiana]
MNKGPEDGWEIVDGRYKLELGMSDRDSEFDGVKCESGKSEWEDSVEGELSSFELASREEGECT